MLHEYFLPVALITQLGSKLDMHKLGARVTCSLVRAVNGECHIGRRFSFIYGLLSLHAFTHILLPMLCKYHFYECRVFTILFNPCNELFFCSRIRDVYRKTNSMQIRSRSAAFISSWPPQYKQSLFEDL